MLCPVLRAVAQPHSRQNCTPLLHTRKGVQSMGYGTIWSISRVSRCTILRSQPKYQIGFRKLSGIFFLAVLERVQTFTAPWASTVHLRHLLEHFLSRNTVATHRRRPQPVQCSPVAPEKCPDRRLGRAISVTEVRVECSEESCLEPAK